MDDRDKSLAGVERRGCHETAPRREQPEGGAIQSPRLGLHEAAEKGISAGQPSLTHPKGTWAGQEAERPSFEEGAAVPVRQVDTHQEWRAQLEALQAQVAAQQSEIAELRSNQARLEQALASQQTSMAEAEQERRREKEEAGRLIQEVSQLSAELSAVRTRLSDRFLWVKLLGQMFAPIAPEGTAGNVTGDGCAAMSECQMEQLVEHFVSGILDSHLNRFRSHVDEQLSQVRDSLDGLHRCQDDQLENLKKQAQAQVALDSRLEQVRKEMEGTAFRVDILANGVTSVQDGLADVDRGVKEADAMLKAGLASANERLETVRHDILQKNSEAMRTLVAQAIEQAHGELEIGLASTNERLATMRQEVLQQSADGIRALQGVMDRHIHETAEEQSLLRQDVQHIAAQVDAMVMKVSHEATDAENTTAAMIEDFKKMQYVLEQKICDASLPDEFADWSVDYVCSRLKGDHEVPQWHGKSLAQVEEVKALVNHFLASHSQENFRRTQGKNFVDCLLIPRRGDRYEPELHRVGGSCLPDKRRNEQEQDFVVDYLNSPGLFLPREPNRPVKAGVTLRRREG